MESFGSVNNKRIAEGIGVDKKSFDKCLDQGRVQDYVDSDFELGETMGVKSTPFVFINGRPFKGLYELAVYEQVIEEELGIVARTVVDDSGSHDGGCFPGEAEADCK